MIDKEQPSGRLFSFTFDPTTGQLVRFETLDASGARHEVSDQEKTSFAFEGSERLEQALEDAFEAGIDCVLGDAEGEDETEESEETKLRQALLTPLIQRSPAKRWLRRDLMNRAILGTLIQYSTKSTPASKPSPAVKPSSPMKPSQPTPGANPTAAAVEPDRAMANRAN